MGEGGTLRMEVKALRAFVRLSYHICFAGERSGVFVFISIFCTFAVTVLVSFFIIFWSSFSVAYVCCASGAYVSTDDDVARSSCGRCRGRRE